MSEQRGHEFLPDGVQRRVRDLRKALLEEIEQIRRVVGERRDRRIGAHRTNGLCTIEGHGFDDDIHDLLRETEHALAQHGPVVRHPVVIRVRKILLAHKVLRDPLTIGRLGGEIGFDLLVRNDTALGGVHQEHLARLHAGAFRHMLWVDGQDSRLGRADDQAVVGNPNTTRAQTIAVQNSTNHRAIGEDDVGGAIPRFHQARVVLIKGADVVG